MEKEQAERPLQSPISLVHVLLPYCDPATVSFRRFLMYQALVIPRVFLSTTLSLFLSLSLGFPLAITWIDPSLPSSLSITSLSGRISLPLGITQPPRLSPSFSFMNSSSFFKAHRTMPSSVHGRCAINTEGNKVGREEEQ